MVNSSERSRLTSLSEDEEVYSTFEYESTGSYTDHSFQSLHRHTHSEQTVQTSNIRKAYSINELESSLHENKEETRRAIFGRAVQKRYAVDPSTIINTTIVSTGPLKGGSDSQSSNMYLTDDELSLTLESPCAIQGALHDVEVYPGHAQSSDVVIRAPAAAPATDIILNRESEQLDCPPPPFLETLTYAKPLSRELMNATPTISHKQRREIEEITPHRKRNAHETIHAQSLLLGLAFALVWSPSNLMAPNLTEMASSFGLMDPLQRDLYLGSYCALATGVLSFPISAGIGILTDLTSRKHLFVATVLGGAVSSILTGMSSRYWHLILARFLNGGFMSGSVPVIFSFLGDLFTTEERNAASSGMTAMMGLGIILGQVYAGLMHFM
jgi:Major Facilitator Superfamily